MHMRRRHAREEERPEEHGVEQAAQLAGRWRRSTWLVAAALVVLGIGGVTASGSLVPRGPLVLPAHALGPNQGEVLGNASAPVLVEEYGDFQCPACASFEREVGPTIRQLVEQGRIRFVFHHDAAIGRESVLAANAATCAGDAGGFWPYHDALYAQQPPENSGALTVEHLIALGRQVGVSGPIFASCVRNDTYGPWVARVTVLASQRGVAAIPAVFVNGRPTNRAGTPAGLLAVVREAASRQ
jgi:protein-disulfide isomerase